MNGEIKIAIAQELEVDPSVLTTETVLADLETWNSVVALTVSVVIADETGTPVSPAELRDLKTFGDIERLVALKTA